MSIFVHTHLKPKLDVLPGIKHLALDVSMKMNVTFIRAVMVAIVEIMSRHVATNASARLAIRDKIVN